MKTLTINIPDSLEMGDKELAMLLAAKLYEQGKISLGQGAMMAGYTKRTFMELLGNYGVSIFNYTAEELERDLANAARYRRI